MDGNVMELERKGADGKTMRTRGRERLPAVLQRPWPEVLMSAVCCIFALLLACAGLTVAAAQPSQTPATAAPAYEFTFTPSPESGTPRILEVQLNSDRLHGGGPIDIRVTTTPDVVKVTTGNGSKSGELTQRAPGVFTSDATLPHIGADLIVKHIKLHFSATTADGTSVSVDAPVTIK